MTARPYQLEALQALRIALRDGDRPVVCIPTGGGKGYILGDIASGCIRKGRRLLILAHVAELVEQNALQCERVLSSVPELLQASPVGILSAGIGRMEHKAQIVSASIQTAFRRACDIGAVDMVVIDEAHLLQPGEESGMYRKFLKEMLIINPAVHICGLTATPYRMKGGLIYGDSPDLLFDGMCYHISVLDLINQGYLSRLTSKAPTSLVRRDFDGLHQRAGDYVAEEVDEIMGDESFVRDGVADMIARSVGRKSILVFCSSVANAEKVAIEITRQTGQEACVITGTTPKEDRSGTIARFKSRELRWLVNVMVLTTGFDAPNIDCIAIFRPTLSPGLFYQQCGRGFRLYPSKDSCLVLDYGGNIERHGPVDMLDQCKATDASKKKKEPPVKVCDNCGEYVPIQLRRCPSCNYEFPAPVRTEPEKVASEAAVTSDQIEPEVYPVQSVFYSVHQKKGTSGEQADNFTLRCDYTIGDILRVSEWVCPNHQGFARRKFESWWDLRSALPPPPSVREAEYMARMGALAPPMSISIKQLPGRKFYELVEVLEYGEIDYNFVMPEEYYKIF